jgi:hypothetical protein
MMTSLFRTIPAMALSLALAAPALANPAGTGSVGGSDRGGGMFDSGQTIDRIPLTATDQGKLTLLYLWILTSNNAVALSTLNAVWQRTENRLPLARIPLLGQLARPDYERADFAPEKQVGTYYYAGKSMLIDLRPVEARAAAPANVEIDWDAIETQLAAEAKRPVEGQIQIDTKAPQATFVRSINVFNQDSSYSMLVGAPAVRAELEQEIRQFVSRLPLIGHLVRRGPVMVKDSELLIMVSPSIVERSWN